MGEYEKTICELFDNNPSNYQIKAIAGMYNIDIEEVKRILLEHDRVLPKAKPKLTTKSSPDPDEQKSQKAADDRGQPVPEAVKKLIFKRIDELETSIREIESRISALEDAKVAAATEYKIIADFISVPFGAGNLSQNDSSYDIAESPQAKA